MTTEKSTCAENLTKLWYEVVGEGNFIATPERLEAFVKALEGNAAQEKPVARVSSWTNGSYHRNYKLEWLQDVEEGTDLYRVPLSADAVLEKVAQGFEKFFSYSDVMDVAYVVGSIRAYKSPSK